MIFYIQKIQILIELLVILMLMQIVHPYNLAIQVQISDNY